MGQSSAKIDSDCASQLAAAEEHTKSLVTKLGSLSAALRVAESEIERLKQELARRDREPGGGPDVDQDSLFSQSSAIRAAQQRQQQQQLSSLTQAAATNVPPSGRHSNIWTMDHRDFDAPERLSMIERVIKPASRVIVDVEEKKIIDEAKRILANFDDGLMKRTELTSPSPLQTATMLRPLGSKDKVRSTPRGQTLDNTTYTMCSGVVTGCPHGVDEMLAYNLCTESKLFQKYHREHEKTIHTQYGLLEILSNHHRKLFFHAHFPPPVTARDCVWSFVWERQSEDVAICIYVPTTQRDRPETPGCIRALQTRVLRFTQLSANEVLFELIFCIDLKGHIPQFLVDNYVMPKGLSAIVNAQEYFIYIQPASKFDQGGTDGRVLGMLFLDKVHMKGGSQSDEALHLFIDRCAALEEVQSVFPFFETFLRSLLATNKAFRYSPSDETLSAVSEQSALKIGVGFSTINIRGSESTEASVEAFFAAFKPMRELRERFHFFRGFLEGIAAGIVDLDGRRGSVVYYTAAAENGRRASVQDRES